MYYSRKIAFLLIALSGGLIQAAMAQPEIFGDFEKNKAEAIAELKNHPRPDTNRINALLKVCSTAIFRKEREAISPYRAEALELSRRFNYEKGLAACYLSFGHLYKSSLQPAEALNYFDSAIYTVGKSTDRRMLEIKASALERKGIIYLEQDNYYAALDYLFESLKYLDYHPNSRKSNIYHAVTRIYMRMNNLDKAEEYAKAEVALIENDTTGVPASGYFSLIDIYLAKKDFELAAHYLKKIAPSMPHPYEIQVNFGYYLKMGELNYEQQQYREAFNYYRQAYSYALKGGHKASISDALRALSCTALKLENPEVAKTYALQNLAIAEEINTRAARMDALMNLSAYYSKTGNTKRAYELLGQAVAIKDSLVSETNIRQVNVLAAIYESEKQQKEILVLQNEKVKQEEAVKQKNTLNIVFIASIAILLFIGYLGYTNFRKGQQIARDQQELQQQKIVELEKDKQLITVDAMLKGQEEERSRIAKDLHDGLGSLLSGAKLSFMNVKENLVLTTENNALFDKSLSMLDNTIGDLRKVAQNLMPEALVKFGLHEALRDFCNYIQSSTDIKVVYQQFGENKQLNNTAEVFIYRIVQELVTNTIRHAEASGIMVQLMMNEGITSLTVEDNGKGFDKNILSTKKGAGIRNIIYRVQYLNGTLDIDTEPGCGTSVTIQLPI